MGTFSSWLIESVNAFARNAPAFMRISKELQLADAEAQKILSLMEEGSIEDFRKLKPVSGLTVLAACASLDDKISANLKKQWLSEQGRVLAEVRHSQKNGTREKRNKVRQAWGTGKYSSRDQCAEAVHAKLGISFSTARKALRGTPSPAKR